jgi:hypothetical protein
MTDKEGRVVVGKLNDDVRVDKGGKEIPGLDILRGSRSRERRRCEGEEARRRKRFIR